ncbi:hypothetical protein OAO42_01645, partial [Candidatus Izimaplasma bacterium]|nr:hypothetical protein [Candidatus Izimaplasma bacterium]
GVVAGDILASGSSLAGVDVDFLFTGLDNNTEYVVYVFAENTDEVTELSMDTATTPAGVVVWGGTDPDTLGWYEIHTLLDLELFRNGLNDNSIDSAADVNLMVDIDMSSEYGDGLKNWVPIGFGDKFKGTFDGMGHTITGLYSDQADASASEGFGFIGIMDKGGVVKNLFFVDVYVIGKQSTGAVCGYCKGQFINVSVSGGTVMGTERVGGLVGRLAEEGYISMSWTDVAVTGSDEMVGGIVGQADYANDSLIEQAIIIEDVYSLGNTIGTTNVGGIAGILAGHMYRALSLGNVFATEGHGSGIVGRTRVQSKSPDDLADITDSIAFNKEIIGQYDNGRITRFYADHVGETVLNVFGADVLALGAKVNGTDITAANLMDPAWFATNLPNWDFTDVWEFQVGAVRPTLKGMTGDDGSAVVHELALMNTEISLSSGENEGEVEFEIVVSKSADIYYVIVLSTDTAPTAAEIKAGVDYGTVTVAAAGNIVGDTTLTGLITGLTGGTEYTIYAYSETTTEMLDVVSDPGTALAGLPMWGETDPDTLGWYEIHTLYDLENYRDGVNDGSISNSSTFKLVVDIDMTSDYGDSGKSWEPIGFGGVKWKGTFDGQGFSITGLYIDEDGVESIGFFGIIEGSATITNVVLKDVVVMGGKATGALAGYAKANITNIIVDGGTITGTERVGGIVGRFAQDGYLGNSWTNVSVTGSSKYIGGVVGHIDFTSDSTDKWIVVEDVYSIGVTVGTEYVGGVVGYLRGTMKQAIAYGGVVATTGTAGGVAGYLQNASKVSPDGAHLIDSIAANSYIQGDNWGVITRTSESNGVPELTNVWGLDTLVDGERENGLDLTAANLVDPAWFATNLPNWDFTSVWEFQVGAVRPTLQGLAGDDGALIVQEPDLTLMGFDLDMGDNEGEIDFGINVNKAADIYYVLVAKDSTVPTVAEIMAGVDYGTVTVVSFDSAMAALMLNGTITGLTPEAEYTIYIYVATTEEILDVATLTVAATAATPLWGGTDPLTLGWYELHDAIDLETYRNGVNDGSIEGNVIVKLMADIDLSADYGVSGKNWEPIGFNGEKFNGLFDGQGFTITGLYSDQTAAGEDEGFGFIGVMDKGGVLQNLNLVNAVVMGKQSVGGACGYCKGDIINVSLSGGSVSGNDRVGGLVGRLAEEGFVSKSWTDTTVVPLAAANPVSDGDYGKYFGGVVGQADYANTATVEQTIIIEDVYSLGSTTGGTYVGGIAGYLTGDLYRSVAYGGVTATAGHGSGLVGYLKLSTKAPDPDSASITDSISMNSSISATNDNGRITRFASSDVTLTEVNNWALDTIATGAKINGTDATAANFADSAWYVTNLPNWDFVTVWELVNGVPVLK